MTRNPANSANADDSWEQLEADLFGIEVGKEHTASERVASEPAAAVPSQPPVVVSKPIEEDDFGDFGAGLAEPGPAPEPRARKSSPPPTRTKPVPPAAPAPVKPLPLEPAPAFNLADLDDGPTDEELDAASEIDDADDSDTEVEAESPENDPYWDALANWNWQEDDRSSKPRSDAGRDRPRSGDSHGRGSSSQRGGPRGRSSERRPPPGRDARPATTDDRAHSAPRRPTPDRDRGRMDEVPDSPVADVTESEREVGPAVEDPTTAPAEVKSRRQDRRRSRRHSHSSPNPDEAVIDQERSEETLDEGWPAAETARSVPAEPPRSRTQPVNDLDDDFEEEDSPEVAEDGSTEATGDEERAPRRRRSRRRRRRPDRPATAQTDTASDEDIKQLEEEAFSDADDDEELSEQPASDESAGDEEADRPSRPRRPRRRRRGGGGRTDRPERPAPAPAPVARSEPEFDDDDEDEEDDEEEVVESFEGDDDDEFDQDQDRQFVEEDTPARGGRRHPRARRSPSDTPFVRHVEDEDDDDSEPEPAVSYEDVPSWEEAISYLLNPSMVEGAGGGGDRGERSGPPSDRGPNDRGHRGGDRSSRPPRRGPRRDA